MKKLLLSIIFIPSILLAQEVTYQLPEVEVTATRELSGISDYPLTTYSVSSDIIEATSPVFLSDIVHLTPSFLPTDNPRRNEVRLMSRGLGENSCTLLLDGVPLANPWDDSFTLSEFVVTQISKVEFVPQGADISSFTTGVGGSINLITLPSVTKKPTYKLGFSAGDNGLLSARVTLTHSIIGRVRAKLGLTHFNYDGYIANTDRKATNVTFSAKMGGLAFSSNYLTEEKGSWGRKSGEARRWPFYNKLLSSLSYNFKPSDGTSFISRLFYQRWDNKLITYTDSTLAEEKWNSVHHNSALGGEFTGNLLIVPNNLLSFGLLGRNKAMNTTNEGDKDILTGTVFLRDFIRLGSTYSFLLGARLNGITDYKPYPSFEAGLTVKPVVWGQLSLSYLNSVRFPALRERYDEYTDDGTHANPDLKPTTSNRYELSLRLNPIEYMRVTVSPFINYSKDFVGKGEGRLWVYENIENTRTRGLDFHLALNLKWLNMVGNYSWVDAINSDSGERLEESPEHFGSIFISANLNYITPYILLTFRSDVLNKTDEGELVNVAGYELANLGLRFTPLNFLSFTLKIDNLFDRNYNVDYLLVKGKPREMKAELKFTF